MADYIKRDIEREIEKWLDDREIILLRGPRQCGKTTLLHWIRDLLIQRGTPQENIVLISFEDDEERLKIEKDPKEYFSFHMKPGKTWFLLDEVQYVKDAGRKLKFLFDAFPKAKVIATGSSSFDLTDMGKALVGRAVFLDVLPFSFREFLRAKSPEHERKLDELRVGLDGRKEAKGSVFLPDFNRHLSEYLAYGSYPRVVLEPDREKKGELVKNLFITYVEKDVVALYGKRHRDSAVKLLKSLALMVGSTVDYTTLSQHSGLKYEEVRKLLPILQDSFVVRIVPPFHRNRINELRKNPKVYFVDYGFRNYLCGGFEVKDMGPMYENFICNVLAGYGPVRYWRTTGGAEVDFVSGEKEIPVEVKSAGKTTRSLVSFIKEYKAKEAFVVSLEEFGERNIEGCRMRMIPLVYL